MNETAIIFNFDQVSIILVVIFRVLAGLISSFFNETKKSKLMFNSLTHLCRLKINLKQLLSFLLIIAKRNNNYRML